MNIVIRLKRFEAPGITRRAYFLNQWVVDDDSNRMKPRNVFWFAIIPAYYQMRSDDILGTYQMRATDIVHVDDMLYGGAQHEVHTSQKNSCSSCMRFSDILARIGANLECGFSALAWPTGVHVKIARVPGTISEGMGASYLTYCCVRPGLIHISCPSDDPNLVLYSKISGRDETHLQRYSRIIAETTHTLEVIPDRDAIAATTFALIMFHNDGILDVRDVDSDDVVAPADNHCITGCFPWMSRRRAEPIVTGNPRGLQHLGSGESNDY